MSIKTETNIREDIKNMEEELDGIALSIEVACGENESNFAKAYARELKAKIDYAKSLID